MPPTPVSPSGHHPALTCSQGGHGDDRDMLHGLQSFLTSSCPPSRSRILSAHRVCFKCNLPGGPGSQEEPAAHGQPAPNHGSLPFCEHRKGARHCSFPPGPKGCREEGNPKGSGEDTNHPNNFAEQSTEEEVTRFSIDTSKLYLQLTPVTHNYHAKQREGWENLTTPAFRYHHTGPHPCGKAPEEVSVMDPSPTTPAQVERCCLPNPALSQPLAHPTSPKPFPSLRTSETKGQRNKATGFRAWCLPAPPAQ